MKDRFVIKVMCQEGSNQHVLEQEFPIEQLRDTPNPRQSLVAHFLYMAREVIAEIDPQLKV